MTTQEFFKIIASHLTDDGVLTINVGSVPGDRRLIDGLATTMGTIFPSIHIMDIPGTLNTMIFATKQPTVRENFSANLVALGRRPKHSSIADHRHVIHLCQSQRRLHNHHRLHRRPRPHRMDRQQHGRQFCPSRRPGIFAVTIIPRHCEARALADIRRSECAIITTVTVTGIASAQRTRRPRNDVTK